MKKISFLKQFMILTALEMKCFWRSSASGLALLVFLGFLGFFFYNGVVSYVMESFSAAIKGFPIDASIVLFSQGLVQVGFVLMLVSPIVTMRSLSPSRQGGHFDFVNAYPLSSKAIIAGQYAAAFLNLIILLTLSLPPYLILLGLGVGSLEVLLSSYLGLCCLAGSFAAIGLLTSAASPSPMGAALASLGLIGVMWMLGWAAPYMDGAIGKLWQNLAFLPRINRFALGLITVNDLIFFLVLSIISLNGASVFLRVRQVSGGGR